MRPSSSVPEATAAAVRLMLAAAIAVSVVHYADNFFNYDAYPQPQSGPAPSQALVAVSWFAFTAIAAARRSVAPASRRDQRADTDLPRRQRSDVPARARPRARERGPR